VPVAYLQIFGQNRQTYTNILFFMGCFYVLFMAQVVDMAWDSSWLTCYLELMNLDPNRRIVSFVIGKIAVVQIWLNWPFMNYGWNVLQHVSSIYYSMGVSCWLACALELICYCFLRFSFLQYVIGKIVVSADTIIFYDSWNTGIMQLIAPSKYNFARSCKKVFCLEDLSPVL